MRHKYETRGIVLSRAPAGEENAFVTIITPNLGLVRARAQGIRRSGAKLAAALATFAESSLVLVHGREGWRVTGAVLEKNWFARIRSVNSRARAARVSGLLLRLVVGEEPDSDIFQIVAGFLKALTTLPEDTHDAVEILAVLRMLAVLGLEKEEIPNEPSVFAEPLLFTIIKERERYIARINRGITASGL